MKKFHLLAPVFYRKGIDGMSETNFFNDFFDLYIDTEHSGVEPHWFQLDEYRKDIRYHCKHESRPMTMSAYDAEVHNEWKGVNVWVMVGFEDEYEEAKYILKHGHLWQGETLTEDQLQPYHSLPERRQ